MKKVIKSISECNYPERLHCKYPWVKPGNPRREGGKKGGRDEREGGTDERKGHMGGRDGV